MKNLKQLLDRAILRSLKDASPYLMPGDTLADEAALRVVPPPTLSEIHVALGDLEARGLILATRTDYAIKWNLTDKGRAFCAEHQI